MKSITILLCLFAINANAQTNLQALIDAAPPGSTLNIAPGDYFPITVNKALTIQSTGNVPLRRIISSDDPNQFIRISATSQTAISITSGSVTLIGFKVTRTDNIPSIISITGDWTGTTVLDRIWVVGGINGSKRGIEANGWSTLITRSRIENVWMQGEDAQGIASWTGPGPLTVDDCYIEGSTETLLVGGNDPINQAHQPTNFTLKNSYLTKQLAWRSLTGTVKNTLEIKNCIGFTIQDNIVEYSWVDGQDGYLLLLTVRNQDGTAPYSNVTNGIVQRNLFRHGAGGVNILGTDDTFPSGRMTNIVLRNNRFEDVNQAMWGTNGHLALVLNGPTNFTFDHNSFIGTGLNSFLSFGNFLPYQPAMGFQYTNNFAMEGQYGLVGDNTGLGQDTLNYYAPNAVWQNICLIQQSPDTITYPPTTIYVPDEATALAHGCGVTPPPPG